MEKYDAIFGTRTESGLIDRSLLDMPQVEKAPQFIKGKDLIGAGDTTFKFLSEFARSGDYQQLTGDIQVINGDTKFKAKWSMNDKIGNKIIDSLGTDTAEWVGKEITVRHAKVNNFDTIELAQETL